MKSFFYMLIPVFAMTVFGYCIFLFVSFIGADVTMHYNYFAVLTCTLLACIINYRLSLREQTLVKVAIVNAALIVFTEVVGFSSYNDIEGVVLHGIAAVIFLIPVVGSLRLSRSPVRANMMLTFSECSIIGLLCLMAMQIGLFEMPVHATVLSIICLVLNLFLLSSLRTEAPAQRKAEVKKKIERSMILVVVIVAAVFAAIAIVIFALPAVRGALFEAIAAVGRFLTFLWNAILSFFAWLAELMPDPELYDIEVMPMEDTSMAENEGMEVLMQIPDSVKIIVIVAIAAFIICAIIIMVFKNRRKKLRQAAQLLAVTHGDIEDRNKIIDLIRLWMRRIVERIILTYKMFEKRNTYAGFFVRLSRIAKYKGFARAPAETSAAFLKRLVPELIKVYSSQKSSAKDSEDLREKKLLQIDTFISELTQSLDLILYAPDCAYSVGIDRDISSNILRLARKMKKS